MSFRTSININIKVSDLRTLLVDRCCVFPFCTLHSEEHSHGSLLLLASLLRRPVTTPPCQTQDIRFRHWHDCQRQHESTCMPRMPCDSSIPLQAITAITVGFASILSFKRRTSSSASAQLSSRLISVSLQLLQPLSVTSAIILRAVSHLHSSCRMLSFPFLMSHCRLVSWS